MDLARAFLTLGGLFLVGLVADTIGRRTRLPRVTLLLACGVLVGRAGFDLLPAEAQTWYEFLSVTALTMVAFLLGNALTRESLARHGRGILAVSAAVVLATFAAVSAGLWLLGAQPPLAVLLGAVATATDPAAMRDVIQQSGVRGGFTDTLEGIVAIDDAWGLLVFSLALALAGALAGAGAGEVAVEALWELGGAVGLGLVVGVPAAYLSGRIHPGDPMRTEALGIVFLTAGLALHLGVSFLVAGMTAGTAVANLARHHDRAFHEIERFEWPFMLLFFVLAGASLEWEPLRAVGLLGVGYLLLRIVGRILGGFLGVRLGGLPPEHGGWYGLALLPQAGVAVGMGLVASEVVPDVAEVILTLTIASTVAFELLGPPATLLAIRRVVPQRTEGTS